ncbi:MAG: DUF2304 domain-containing protein [Pseudomonadota bacterium]
MTYQVTTTVIGVLLGSLILYMVRRDRMHGPYAYWWLTVAGATIVLGIFPRLIDRAAELTGIAYPPTLLFAVAIALILLKMLRSDVEISRHERRIRRLAQHIAIVSDENRRLREQLEQQTDPGERLRTGSD